MFVRDPFDIAPGASRHTSASWVALALGAIFLVISASLLYRGWQTVKQAEDVGRRAQEAARAQARAHAAARLKADEPLSLERLKEQRKLQQVLRMSWSGLFDALESAGQGAEGRVSVLALTPIKAQADGAEIGITALAASNEILLNYIKALEKEPRVRKVNLSTQQPALHGKVEVVRFQLFIVWEQLK